MSTPTQQTTPEKTIISRIFIKEDGDVVVTDMWEEVRELLEGKHSTETKKAQS